MALEAMGTSIKHTRLRTLRVTKWWWRVWRKVEKIVKKWRQWHQGVFQEQPKKMLYLNHCKSRVTPVIREHSLLFLITQIITFMSISNTRPRSYWIRLMPQVILIKWEILSPQNQLARYLKRDYHQRTLVLLINQKENQKKKILSQQTTTSKCQLTCYLVEKTRILNSTIKTLKYKLLKTTVWQLIIQTKTMQHVLLDIVIKLTATTTLIMVRYI